VQTASNTFPSQAESKKSIAGLPDDETRAAEQNSIKKSLENVIEKAPPLACMWTACIAMGDGDRYLVDERSACSDTR
jgi:hypothetical protein